MGFPMVAKRARPESDVIIDYGDVSVGFDRFEFEAMVRQGIEVTAVVGNDACWTQSRWGLVQLCGKDRAAPIHLDDPRYDKVIEALAGHGEYVEHPGPLQEAFARVPVLARAALVSAKNSGCDLRKGAIFV